MNTTAAVHATTIIFTERRSVFTGHNAEGLACYETMPTEVERHESTQAPSAAVGWARTYATPWQGWIIMFEGKIYACAEPKS